MGSEYLVMFERHTSFHLATYATQRYDTGHCSHVSQRNATQAWVALHFCNQYAAQRYFFNNATQRKIDYWWLRMAQQRHFDIQADTYAAQRCRKGYWSIPSHYNATQRNIIGIHSIPDNFNLSRDTHYYHDECKICFTWHSSRDLATQACLY